MPPGTSDADLHDKRYSDSRDRHPIHGSEKKPEMMTNDAAIGSADGMDLLLQPWQQLATQLSPLIGDSGFCALYGRAARLAAKRFGWLAPVQAGKTIVALLAGLRAQLAAAGLAEATAANALLLHTFTKLLAGLIGESLTMRILDAAPAGASFPPVQEQQ